MLLRRLQPVSLALILLWGAEALACEQQVGVGRLGELATAFDEAFVQRDRDGLVAGHERLFAELGCLREPLVPAEAARVHRIEGIEGFLEDDRTRAIRAFESARVLDADYRIPSSLVDEDHPLRQLYQGVSSVPGEPGEALPAPAAGWLTIDGIRGDRPPVGRPWIFQRIDAAGEVVDTRYVHPGEAPPDYPVASPTVEPAPNLSSGAPSLAIGARLGVLGLPNGSASDAYGRLGLSAAYRLVGRTWLGLSLGTALAPETYKGQSGVAVLPYGTLGVQGALGAEDGFHPRLGLAAVVASHDETPVSVGGVVTLGLAAPVGSGGRWGLELDGGLLSGHAGDPQAWIGAQLGFDLLR